MKGGKNLASTLFLEHCYCSFDLMVIFTDMTLDTTTSIPHMYVIVIYYFYAMCDDGGGQIRRCMIRILF